MVISDCTSLQQSLITTVTVIFNENVCIIYKIKMFCVYIYGAGFYFIDRISQYNSGQTHLL